MRRYLGWFLNGFALTFAIPSFLIIISWNALPGEQLYGIKTGLEKVALGITIKTPLASILSVKYTERRFTEANSLLSKKASTVGYQLLVAETNQSRKIIVDKNDQSRASELVVKIEEYQKEIQSKKVAIQTGKINLPVAYQPPNQFQEPPLLTQPTTTQPTATPAPLTIPSPTPPITTTPPTSASEIEKPAPQTKVEIINNLEKTEKQLEEIKEDLKKRVPPVNEHQRERPEESKNRKPEERE